MLKKKSTMWKQEIDKYHILWLIFDDPSKSVNTLGSEALNQLNDILDHLPNNIEGIIITSGKDSGFIAGADVEEFSEFEDPKKIDELISHGQEICNKIESIALPTLALINGYCLGGGLELALACRYRVALDELKTRLGLPEVKLGIHPGWGGSVRLLKHIGAPAGMDLVLTGRTVTAKVAEKMGFIDAAVPLRQLKNAAISIIKTKPAMHHPSCIQRFTNSIFARRILAKVFEYKLYKKIKPTQYPAPFAIVKNWKKFGVDTLALHEEAQSLLHIAQTDTAVNLSHVFFLQEKLKGLAKQSDFMVNSVHVIGAGVMGGDIAAWCALRGFNVTLQDMNPAMIASTMKRAYQLYSKKLKCQHLIQQAMDRLMPDIGGLGILHADMIIEAVSENIDLKQKIFQDIEKKAKAKAILATNTSSIPLDEINKNLKKPERLVGIHFFNPVSQMMLVEVVKGVKTKEKVFDQAISFVRAIDKLPLPVKSSPGFLVNRVLMPYLMEGMVLLEEGIPARIIDSAAVDFGMPMGPIELADTVGLDVCLSVARNLNEHLGGSVPEKLVKMVDEGLLGRKSGEGFYRYKYGKLQGKSNQAEQYSSSEIAKRLINKLIYEAIDCLNENVVENQELLDAGMIFGTGFAPFRGGLLRYASTVEDKNIQSALKTLQIV